MKRPVANRIGKVRGGPPGNRRGYERLLVSGALPVAASHHKYALKVDGKPKVYYY